MKPYNKKMILFLVIFILALLTTSCSYDKADPDVTIKNFFQAVKKQDLNAMNELTKNVGNKMLFKYEDGDRENLNKAIFAKVNYQILTTKGDETTKIIRVSINSPDMVRIYSKIINDSASGVESGDKRKINSLINLINDANSPKVSNTVDVKLIKDKNGWLIEPSKELLNAITGNLEKAEKSADKFQTSGLKADSKIYSIGEEAVSGKLAITVTRIEVSTQSGYVKLGEGNKFIIVYLKERNISEQELSYDKSEFKIQISNNQIIEVSPAKLGKEFGPGKLSPGESTDGTITFEVPQSNVGLTLIYSLASQALLKFKLE